MDTGHFPPCPVSAEDKFHVESHRCAPIRQSEGEDDLGREVSPSKGSSLSALMSTWTLLESSFRSKGRQGGGVLKDSLCISLL